MRSSASRSPDALAAATARTATLTVVAICGSTCATAASTAASALESESAMVAWNALKASVLRSGWRKMAAPGGTLVVANRAAQVWKNMDLQTRSR